MLLAVLLVAVVLPASTATDYTVGESSGWTIGVDYSAWTEGKTFHIGDTLSFQYNPVHSVMEVSAADHGACSTSNPLGWYTDQSTTIQLTDPGTRYFICGTSGHCGFGMNLAVTVVFDDSRSSATRATSSSTVMSAKPSKSTRNDDVATSAATTTATAAPGSSSKLT
ncbi:hypothetical protein PR202_gb14790 [Eleusine coracana subsp. coracana]|uniref:Phytocyanin domain-containing protein n=1 Tax=Eleusine coracana subsp. coracana TaxID=191504 RepID=A0AAV5EX70_ELECO|nr:hypothetical protein PR202_gb14790 [Eleusine coracana subsp. coracana]